jgi:hypothetical protein
VIIIGKKKKAPWKLNSIQILSHINQINLLT